MQHVLRLCVCLCWLGSLVQIHSSMFFNAKLGFYICCLLGFCNTEQYTVGFSQSSLIHLVGPSDCTLHDYVHGGESTCLFFWLNM